MRLKRLSSYAAVAAAFATPLALTAPASATATGSGSAFGIAASGLVSITPTPSVSSSAQKPATAHLAELSANPLARAGVLNVSAWAGHGRAGVADVRLAEIGLSASAVTAKCENGNGVSHLVKAMLGGRKLAVAASPNTAITVPVQGVGSVAVTLNKQVRNAQGALTVTALELSVKLSQAKAQTISIASVTCAKTSPGTPTKPTTPNKPNMPGKPGTPTPPGTPAAEAPTPTPVNSDLPVTG
jgi:hypothetical protein